MDATTEDRRDYWLTREPMINRVLTKHLGPEGVTDRIDEARQNATCYAWLHWTQSVQVSDAALVRDVLRGIGDHWQRGPFGRIDNRWIAEPFDFDPDGPNQEPADEHLSRLAERTGTSGRPYDDTLDWSVQDIPSDALGAATILAHRGHWQHVCQAYGAADGLRQLDRIRQYLTTRPMPQWMIR